MSMFFMIVGHGKYDRNGGNWDEGVTHFAKPFHRTKDEAVECCGKTMNLDKSTCPLVQRVDVVENNGRRQVTLLVKAMGYQQAEDRARVYCKEHFPVKKMARNKQISRNELLEKDKKTRKDGSFLDIFNALPRALSKFTDKFEYYTKENRDDEFQSRGFKQSVSGHKNKRTEYMGKKRNYDRSN